jgi:hypothetical protein
MINQAFYLRIYAHRAGMPLLLFESELLSISLSRDTRTRIDYDLTTPMTFRQGNVFWVTYLSVTDQCSTGVLMSADSGGVSSAGVAVKYNSTRGRWVRPDGGAPRSMRMRAHGCEVP